MKLLIQAFLRAAAGFLLCILLLCGPAGTWRYPGAWLLCGLLFVPMGILGLLLWRFAPELLEKRMQIKETDKTQKLVVLFSSLLFIAAFAAAGLDFRYGWTHVPGWLVGIGAAVQLLSYGLYAEVLRENAFLSRTVEVQEHQTVIDTGLYGIVRHPMYTATILLCLSMALVLGSWICFGLLLLFPALLVRRIFSEEAILEAGLPGYAQYKTRVRWRLLPYIW